MRISFMTNQIIKRNNIYIYSYLINCEYFNNLNENVDMVGTGIMAGICPSPYHPHIQLKKSGILIPIPIPSQCGDSPSKRERVRTILTGTDLFAISRWKILQDYVKTQGIKLNVFVFIKNIVYKNLIICLYYHIYFYFKLLKYI